MEDVLIILIYNALKAKFVLLEFIMHSKSKNIRDTQG
jgi:hypothetical protein